MKNLPDFFRSGMPGFSGDPYREMLSLQRQMDRLFNDMWKGTTPDIVTAVTPAFTPSCDMTETGDHYLMSFDLPGVKKEDIKIELDNDRLTVSGERREECQGECEKKGKNHYHTERFYGSFSRSFQIPAGTKADKIETHYSDGVLRLAIPKADAAKTQSIPIGDGKSTLWEKLLGRNKDEAQAGPQPKTLPKGQPQAQEKRLQEKVA